MTIPSRHILTTADQTNRQLGHENLGFLSESHGFMPRELPLLALPASHRVWDEMAAQLPEMFRCLTLRRMLDNMPVLSAAEDVLPDVYVLRASAIFSIFAHAYFYVEGEPPGEIPNSILQPWAEISHRLQRPAPHLSFIDLNVYNWKLKDPYATDPMRVENMELLIPILGNEDERRFQCVPIEMLAQFAPVVGAVVRAQEAVSLADSAGLARELQFIGDALHGQTYESFMKVNPNPYGWLYVNPVVWGKTVAPLATPYQTSGEIPGPSGTAVPAFQLLDIFFGRHSYQTNIGHETMRVRPWFPPHWQAFLTAVEQISVPQFIQDKGDAALRGLFQEVREAYTGDTGLLGRHRLKTYGFLDLSFKAGRSKTLGGFSGEFDDRMWDKMDAELNLARLERYGPVPQNCHFVRLKRVESVAGEAVKRIVLDASEAGIRYRPGDRCAILPENSDELVEKTLGVLRASGDEPIQLNNMWREAVKLRDGFQEARVLSLRTLLKFGRIRSVSRPVAKALYTISHNEMLWRIIEARAEDQWVLWQLLELLAQSHFNPKRLWKAAPGERESIGWIVPPESWRVYSISSAENGTRINADDTDLGVQEIYLTVGRLAYETKETAVSPPAYHTGTASRFLTSLRPERKERISIRLIHPPRFGLPKDPTRPIVMFAGGTGVAPFRGLIQERISQKARENWLFFSTRSPEYFYYQGELSEWVTQGNLQAAVAFSRAETETVWENGRFSLRPGARQRIQDLMLQPDNAERLWNLLRSRAEGGEEAYFYVCGRTGFAKAVMDTIKIIIGRFALSPLPPKVAITPALAHPASELLYRLVGSGRYLQEIFTTYAGPQFEQTRLVDASEVVTHNNDQEGYWAIISGRVYDLTEFAYLHPGGGKIIRSYAGLDATVAYQKVLHDVNPEVDSMLGMYEIGAVRRLNFGSAWGVVITSDGLNSISLKDVYRAWIGLLYQVVEMENALLNDYAVRYEPVTYNETAVFQEESPYKLQLFLQTHGRFIHSYLGRIIGQPLAQVWALTSGLCSEELEVGWMVKEIAAVQKTAEAQTVTRLAEQILHQLKDPAQQPWCHAACALLETEDKRFLQEMKMALRTGVQVFEQRQQETHIKGRPDLLTAAHSLPSVLMGYYSRIAKQVMEELGS